jgi:hypothetical protein
MNSDLMVYDIRNYDINKFEKFGWHNHPEIDLEDYFKNIFLTENDKFEPRNKSS